MSDSKEADVRGSVNIYKMMLKNKQFIFGVFILGLSYSIVMLFNTTGPFIIENTFNFTPVTIGYCTLLLGFSWVLGGMIAKINMGLAFRFRVFVPLLIQLVAAGVLLGISFFYQNLVLTIGFAFLIHTVSGVLFTSFFTSSMLFFPAHAGTAGGVMGGLVYIITSVISFVISLSGRVSTLGELAGHYLILSVLLALVVLSLLKMGANGRRAKS